MDRRSITNYLSMFLRHGREIAYVQPRGYRTVRWTYQQVAEMAFRFARELESRAIGKGEHVLLWGPNSAEWVTVFLGCALRGVVVVPIDDIATPDFALRIHAQVSARLMVCSRVHVQSSMDCLVLQDIPETVAPHSSLPYPDANIEPTDTLEIVFTSGSTADPKGVVISHANVLANVTPLETEIQKYLKYERFVHPVRFLNLLPLSHVFGQFLGIFLPPLMAGTVIFHDTLNPAELIRTIKRERVSVLVTVPRVLQSLKEKIERDLQDARELERFQHLLISSKGKHFLHRWWIFRRIRRQFGWKFWAFICGGAALDSLTEEFWDRLGYAVVQGYGLTETTSLISVNHPFRLGKGSIGKVLAGREVKLAPDGEILVRGGGVATGYWGRDNTSSEPEGWYHTGDVGELDSAGNLFFKGRKKEVIVTPAGMNVYPEDLEAALRRQSEIKDVLVVPLSRNGNAEPCAVVIPRNHGGDLAAVVKRANESLAEYQQINRWWIWPQDDFPRTATQKPRRNLILDATEQHFNQSYRQSQNSPLADLIAKVTGRSPASFTANANLESDLNLSSLDRVELLSVLEDRFQMDLSETRFASLTTVGDLERMLQGDVPPRTRYHYPAWVLRPPTTWVRFAIHYLLLRPAVLLLGWPKVEGRTNLRGVNGPVLVVCNHIGDVDPGFVLTALPMRLRHRLAIATGGEALEVLRTPKSDRSLLGRAYDRIRWTLGVALLNLFPLPREAGFRESFAYAGTCVDRGYSVLVFPEGHHTLDDKLRPFRAGVGLLVQNLQIPVIPMRIDGLFAIKKAGRKFALPRQIRVKIGAPIVFPSDSLPEAIAQELQRKIEDL